jgi:hypothetical protein
MTSRSPESILMARRRGPATAMALRMPCVMSYVSTRSVVSVPNASICASKASISDLWSSVNACALVPEVGTP